MTDYPFDIQLVVDPNNPANVVLDAIISIYDPADTGGTTLIDLKDPFGMPLANPLHSNHLGYLEPFSAELPQVMWRAGSYSGLLESYVGLRDQAVAAAAAADASQTAAEAAEAMAEATANGFTASATTGAAGSSAVAAFTGTAPARHLNLTIPRGDTGATGAAGAAGATGPAGPTGPAGADGHNPITVSTTAPSSPVNGDIWFDIS